MEDQLSLPRLHLAVVSETLPLFTTVLQSGIEIKASHGESLAHFLNAFPGFTAEYLAETVQTIFLNGTAVDDLGLQLTGKNPVLALSAAMPGLAGAIFRRNSFHSALRTETKSLQSLGKKQDTITVTLKLFNSIARERGEELLKNGVCIGANHFHSFLRLRPHLMKHIRKIELDQKEITHQQLSLILPDFLKVNLNISGTDG